jgi:hypothetical protein
LNHDSLKELLLKFGLERVETFAGFWRLKLRLLPQIAGIIAYES